MNLREINAGIKRVQRSSAALNTLIQSIAVGCIIHAQATGDCTPALRLVQAMPKSHRRGLLVTYFSRYSPIGMNVTSNKCGLHKVGSKAYNAFNVDGARANNWYESPEAAKEDLPDTTLETARNVVYGTIKRLQKRLDDGDVVEADAPAITALIAGLTAVAKKEFPRKAANDTKAPAPVPAVAG